MISPGEQTQLARVAIISALPTLYEEFWSSCDKGDYFGIRIPRAPSNRLAPRNLLLRSGTPGLRMSYTETIEHAAMSLAAETIASTFQDPSIAAGFRVNFRDREYADAIRSYLRFLDHVSYHFYEISGRDLPRVKAPRDVSFTRLAGYLEQEAVPGSRRLLRCARRIVSLARAGLEGQSWRGLQDFRNIDTHRYVNGMDHIMPWIRPSGTTAKRSYSLVATPELSFESAKLLLKQTMSNARAIMMELTANRLLLTS